MSEKKKLPAPSHEVYERCTSPERYADDVCRKFRDAVRDVLVEATALVAADQAIPVGD